MGYRAFIVLLPLLLLVSCSSGSEVTSPPTSTTALEATEAPTSTPTATQPPAEPPAPTPTVAVVETEPPTSTATVESEPTESAADTPAPTDTLPPPTPTTPATSTPTPQPPPAPQASGMAGFRNNLATADQFVLNLTGVSAPPDGQAYQGWLIADDGTMTSVGVLNVNPDGSVALTWNSPTSENLLSSHSGFQITLEPAGGSDSPTGQVVFAGGLDSETLIKARQLFVKNEGVPATPLNTAFALGLIAQTDIGIQHVQNAVNAAAIGSLPEMRTHLEHVINILEGAAGPRFSDYDGSGTAENPGDGFGVVGYSGQMGELLSDQAVTAAVTDVQAQIVTIQDKCLEILQIEDLGAATAHLGELKGMADQFKAGPIAQLYRAGQEAVSFAVTPVE